MNEPDDTSSQAELVGVNIPEFFEALRTAASLAHGFFWKPMEIWQSRNDFRKFQVCRREGRPNPVEWLRVTTVTPHSRKSR